MPEHGDATGISSLHKDILEAHILTRLDGQTLASASCASTSLSAQDHHVWFNICRSTWPSTSDERVSKIVSTFSDNNNGPRHFFSRSFPLPTPEPTTVTPPKKHKVPPLSSASPPTSELISAVDIFYRSQLIFSKTKETETLTGWFRYSPFRIDMLGPKEVIQAQMPYSESEDTSTAMMNNMTLSWIIIDPVSLQSVNLSSYKPVSVQRHWLNGEVQVRFASIIAGEQRMSATALVQCRIVVNCGSPEDMQVREVSLEVEDMDGKHLNGKDSLVIVGRATEGKRGSGVKREEKAMKIYKEFEEMKRERRERKLRFEGQLDNLCMGVGLLFFAALFFIFV